jgi:hypothetical protein
VSLIGIFLALTSSFNVSHSSISVADKRRLSSGLHSPLFAVVMKSPNIAKQLECHGFICHSPEDAIVIAATLYQSLMAYMGSGSSQVKFQIISTKKKVSLAINTRAHLSAEPADQKAQKSQRHRLHEHRQQLGSDERHDFVKVVVPKWRWESPRQHQKQTKPAIGATACTTTAQET